MSEISDAEKASFVEQEVEEPNEEETIPKRPFEPDEDGNNMAFRRQEETIGSRSAGESDFGTSSGQPTGMYFAAGSNPKIHLQQINRPTIIKELHAAGNVQIGASSTNKHDSNTEDGARGDKSTRNKEFKQAREKEHINILLVKLKESIIRMPTFKREFKGVKQLKEFIETPVLLSMTFDEFIEMKKDQQNKSSIFDMSKTKNIGKKIELKELHISDGTKHRHVMVCAAAGHGKSSLLRHYAKLVVSGQIDNLNHIHLVVYLQFNKLVHDADVYLWQFITGFNCPDLQQKDKQEVLRWMIDNCDKVCFVLDGIDEFSGNLKVNGPEAEYHDIDKQSNFIRSLLSGHIFKASTILSSSREFAITNLPVEAQPDQVVVLNGFTRDSIDKIIHTVCKDDEQKILHLKARSNFLYGICSIPFYLMMSLAVILKHPNNLPETLTSLMVHALVNFMESRHIKSSSSNIRNAIKLAAYGIENHKTIFNASDLKNAKVTPSEISDFTVAYADESYSVMQAEVKEKNMLYSFPHKLFQEFYCALEILHMRKDEQKKQWLTLREDLHYVQMFSCGIMFNNNNITLLQTIENLNLKIPKAFKEKMQNHQQLKIENFDVSRTNALTFETNDILHLIYESVDIRPQLSQHLHSIIILHQLNVTTSYDIACLFRVFPLCKELQLLYISSPSLTAEVLQMLVESQNIPTVKSLYINASSLSVNFLGRFVGRCKPQRYGVLNIHSKETLQSFTNALLTEYNPLLLETIGFNYCTISSYVAELLTKCDHLTYLVFENCKFDEAEFEETFTSLINVTCLSKLEKLWFEKTINPLQKKVFYDLISNHKTIQQLGVRSCDVTKASLLDFIQHFNEADNCPLKSLDLSGNKGIVCNKLAQFVSKFSIKKLWLVDCVTDESELTSFIEGLQPGTKFDELYISGPWLIDISSATKNTLKAFCRELIYK